ncbi:MAG: AAA family ATPase [Firmicutes bacterium]|nr:AAA family ATPase [Bacillota bacterium]
MEHERLLSDDPLENPEEDLFGYVSSYAKRLAEIISKTPKDKSLVLALNGPWGAGKTTCLNFIVKYIENNPKEAPIIIRFNPWLFSGHSDLAGQFFRELRAALENKLCKHLIQNIVDFASIISEVPEPTGIIKIASSVLLKINRRTAEKKELWELKTQISQELMNQNRKLLVLIDDIDRLSQEEIRDLFKLIKSIADFPNMHYILAFDKNVINKALKDIQGISEEDYISKIVQVALDLPMPDKIVLRKLFLENINKLLLAQTPEELFDNNYFLNLYWTGIDHFLKTPRDLKQLINTLKINYPTVKGEVNPADFIAIETLRIFAHDLYYTIRSKPEMFYSDAGGITERDENALKSFHKGLIEKLPENDKKPLMSLLRQLFPMLEGIEGLYGNIHYGAEFVSEWRKKLRVCVKEIFPIYFRFSVPEGDMSNIEINTLLALLDDIEAFGNKLIELSRQIRPDGYTRLSVFLERLLDFIDKIPTDQTKNLLKALFNVGDYLLVPEDEPKGIFGWGNDIRIGRVFFRILKRYKTPQDRFKILKEIFNNGRAISIIVNEIISLGQQHGKYGGKGRPDPEKLINIEHQEALEKIALEKINEAANTGELFKTPALATILYRWRDWENEDAPKKWIENILGSDKNLVTILTAFLTKGFSQNLDEVVPRINWRLNPKTLEPFLDPNAIIHRCRLLLLNLPEWLTEKEKIAVETFVKEFDSLQRKNIDETEGN